MIKPARQPAEAEQRFFTRYSEIVGRDNWSPVQGYLYSGAPKPTTVEGWIESAVSASKPSHSASQAATA